jgi:2-amino-4-hydroxy-6-hydroxymethyldihydropteridine diphosphokinase
MAVAYIGVGSNLGNRQAVIKKALGLLNEIKAIEVRKVSALHETDPVGGPPQGKFLNAVLEVHTSLLPLELLAKLKGIEKRLGRKKSLDSNGPRIIDLDILFYDDVVIKGRVLEIPHPRLHQRSFVLKPLSEIAPEVIHPLLNKKIKQLLAEIQL